MRGIWRPNLPRTRSTLSRANGQKSGQRCRWWSASRRISLRRDECVSLKPRSRIFLDWRYGPPPRDCSTNVGHWHLFGHWVYHQLHWLNGVRLTRFQRKFVDATKSGQAQPRTDHLSAAVRRLASDERAA